MAEQSWSYKSWLDTMYIRRTPEKLSFVIPPVWMFGQGREYRVNDEQAALLVALIRRDNIALGILMTVALIAFAVVATVMAPKLFIDNPFVAFLIVMAFVLPCSGLSIGTAYSATRLVLPGVSWTSAPREPYRFAVKRGMTGTMGMLTKFPTWLLILTAVGMLIMLSVSMRNAYTGLASGNVNYDLLTAPGVLFASVLYGWALVAKLKARRSAQ
jgi:hypothetical protein